MRSFATAEQLRREVLDRVAMGGGVMIAHGWGTSPTVRADFVASLPSMLATAAASLRRALARGLMERRHLWLVVEQYGHRRLLCSVCYRYGDGWSIRAIVPESAGPKGLDVPGVVWREAQRPGRGANPAWRAAVEAHRRQVAG